MAWIEFVSKLGLALVLGSAIGIERQWRQRSAGLRTNALVSLGAAAFVLLSRSLTTSGGDPSRIASQIVAGIGFLGAGVIMHEGLTVQGLNTAATIWCSAAVGSLAGAGLAVEAVIAMGAVVLTHLVLRPVGFRLSRLPLAATQVTYLFTVRARTEVENHVRVLLMQRLAGDDGLLLHSLDSSDNGDPSVAIVTAEILAHARRDNVIEKVASMLTVEQGVTQVRWRVTGEQHED
jgi:putative Mg2+ transporter-C (MgtC) family protein